MSFLDERAAITGRFQTQWQTTYGHSAIPIAWEGFDFDVDAQTNNAETPWCVFHVLTGSGTQMNINSAPNRVYRYPGIIQVDLYTRDRNGAGDLLNLANDVASIFRNQQFSSGNSGRILTRVPSILPITIDEGRLKLVVSIPYIRDFSA